jgi:cysteine-rich repeat protein
MIRPHTPATWLVLSGTLSIVACANPGQTSTDGLEAGSSEDGTESESTDTGLPDAGDGDGDGDACPGAEPPPDCGNGELDGDEACDDGNERNGDGCNNDCTPSGQQHASSHTSPFLLELDPAGGPIWELSGDDPLPSSQLILGLATGADDCIAVTGSREVIVNESDDAWVRVQAP